MDGVDIATTTDTVSTGGGNEATTTNNNKSVSPSSTSEENETVTPWECQLFMENVSIQFDNSSSLIPLKGKTDVISMAKHGKIYLDGDKYRDETAWDQLCDDIKVACNLSGYYMCSNGKFNKKIKSGMEVIEEIEGLRLYVIMVELIRRQLSTLNLKSGNEKHRGYFLWLVRNAILHLKFIEIRLDLCLTHL